MSFEANGIPFVAERSWTELVSGLKVDVESFYGREGIVAYHRDLGSSC